MGLFDWLTDAIGSGGGGGMPSMNPMGDMMGSPSAPMPGSMPGMPPVQSLETAPPPMPPISGPQNHEPYSLPMPPQDGGFMPGGPPPMPPTDGGFMSPAGRTPMPMPRPPGAPGAPEMAPPPGPGPGPAALPPNAAPTGGAGMPPGPPTSPGPMPGAPPEQGNALTRALGIDPNTARQVSGSLASGLQAAGANSHKPGLAAFAGSAGAAMEGGNKADDKTLEKQDKYLQRAIQAERDGDMNAYRTNLLRFQIEKTKAELKLETQKMAQGGKNSVVNSPEQLYLRAVGATNQDASIKISANTVKEAQKQFGADSPQAKEALKAHEKQIETVRNGHFQTLGIDPKSVKGLESKEGFSDKNPVKSFPKDPAAAQKTFDALPEGAYFINPKDGRLLTKKTAAGVVPANPTQPGMSQLEALAVGPELEAAE